MGLDMYLKDSFSNEVGYWRKANQIHKWFVDKVQDGKDNCGKYNVKFDQLLQLKELCQECLKTSDATKLPPSDGFFFGSMSIDAYYWQDLKETIKTIDSLDPGGLYYYQADW